MEYKQFGDLVFTQDIKDEAKAEIIQKIGELCTGNVLTCHFRECQFFSSCQKEDYSFEKLPNKRHPLLKLIKHLRKDERKKLDLPHPPDKISNRKLKRMKFESDFHGSIRKILGQDIWEHELVVGHEPTILRIKEARSLFVIANILNQRHKEKYGKKKVFGSRDLYRQHIGENKDWGFHIPPWEENQ